MPEDYVHRIGRTGRAGTKGEAISLVCVDENGFLRDIERLTKNEIPKEIVPGFEPPSHERPEPIVLGRMVIGEGAARGGMRPNRDASRGGNGRGHGGGGGGGSGGGGRSGNGARPGNGQGGGAARPSSSAPRRDSAGGTGAPRSTFKR